MPRWIVSTLVLALVGCGSESGVRGDGGAVAGDVSVNGDDGTMCPDSSVSSDPSGGACSGGVGCVFIWEVGCGPGVNFVPASPPVYVCDCGGGTWECTKQPGGYGLIECNGGADEGGPPVTGSCDGGCGVNVCFGSASGTCPDGCVVVNDLPKKTPVPLCVAADGGDASAE
jgi:hypothetical protein